MICQMEIFTPRVCLKAMRRKTAPTMRRAMCVGKGVFSLYISLPTITG